MKVSALLRETARRFSRARLHFGHGTHDAIEETAWLLSSVLGSPLDPDAEVGLRNERRIRTLVRRRIRDRVPLAYLLREAWLGKHSFYVDRRAVVPRSYIAELLRARLRPWLRRPVRRALDLCTGSGCLAVLVAHEFPRARVEAADLSPAALEVARINIKRHRLGRRVRVFRSDLFASLAQRQYDLIVCNPPYVTERSMRALPGEYRHEPALALAGGIDGLDVVRRIIAEARGHLAPEGLLVCEIGGNRRAIERAYPALPFIWPETSEGAGCVFILERGQFPGAHPARTAAASGTRATRVRANR